MRSHIDLLFIWPVQIRIVRFRTVAEPHNQSLGTKNPVNTIHDAVCCDMRTWTQRRGWPLTSSVAAVGLCSRARSTVRPASGGQITIKHTKVVLRRRNYSQSTRERGGTSTFCAILGSSSFCDTRRNLSNVCKRGASCSVKPCPGKLLRQPQMLCVGQPHAGGKLYLEGGVISPAIERKGRCRNSGCSYQCVSC